MTSAPSKTDPSVTTHEQSSLTAAVTYRFKVKAVNQIGESIATDFISVIAADLPDAPSNSPTINSVTKSYATITLTALPTANNGGSAVTGYIVQMDDGIGGDFETIHDSLTLTLTVGSLIEGRTYRFRYAARNIVYD